MSLFLQGYVVRISGGNDKQGFPMKQGVLTHGRVRLLLSKGHSCYRPRRTGERKRKSVRGCIVDANLSVLNLVIVKKGKMKQSVERSRHLEWTCLLVAVKFCRIQTLNINRNSLNAYWNSFWALYCNLWLLKLVTVNWNIFTITSNIIALNKKVQSEVALLAGVPQGLST